MSSSNSPDDNSYIHEIPEDDDVIYDTTKSWVNTMMSNMGVCPFTSGSDMAGLPMGKVFYEIERTNLAESLYEKYWNEVVRVEKSN